MKWIAPLWAYLAVGTGLFVFHSAWGALLGFHAAILGSLLLTKPDVPFSVLFKSTNVKWILLSILLTGSSGAMLFFLWGWFHVADNLPAQLEALGLTSSTWPAFIAYFAAVNPFIEEYFWRGYLGNPAGNLHTSDFLYAGFHALILIGKVPASSIVFAIIMLTLAGWIWRQITREDGGLLAPVVGHMAADFTILLAVFTLTT